MKRPSVFLGLREGVRRLFAFQADGPGQMLGPASLPLDPASAPAQVSAARFGLIGLSELREAVGPRWPELEERVRALAEAVITRHLIRGDVFEAQEDGGYVVLFAQLNKEEADFKCRVIGREITERLLGSESPRLADVETVSVEVTREALAAGDVELVFARAFAAGERIITSDPAAPRPEAPRATHGPAGSARGAATAVPQSPELAPAHGPARDGREPRPANGAADETSAAGRDRGVGHMEPVWHYAPIWDFKSKSLVRFRLTSRPEESTTKAATGRQPVGFDVDLALLSKGADDLSRLAAEGRRVSVVCVVHQTSLGVQSRCDQLIEVVSRASAGVRRLLSVEVFSPEFQPNSALKQFVEALDTLGVQAAAGVPLGSREAVRPAATLLKTASAEVPEGLSEADALSLLNTFSRRSAQSGLESAAHGLDTRSLVMGAMAAGVRFLCGHAVHPAINDLGAGLRFEPADLYRDLLGGRGS